MKWKRPRRAYISGKMRGLPHSNFPAFDAAKAFLISQEIIVSSPADLSRAAGYTGEEEPRDTAAWELHQFANVDAGVILELEEDQGDFIALLPGDLWTTSVGAKMEVALALFKKLPILDAFTLQPRNVRIIGSEPMLFKPHRDASCLRPVDGLIRG